VVGDGNWVATEVREVASVIAIDKTEAKCLIGVERSERVRLRLQRCVRAIAADVGRSESDVWFDSRIRVTQCDLESGSGGVRVNKLVPEWRAGTVTKDSVCTWLVVEPGIFSYQVTGKDFDCFAEGVVIAESVEVNVSTYEVTSKASSWKCLDRASHIVVIVGKVGWRTKTAAPWKLYYLCAIWCPNNTLVITKVNHEVWRKIWGVSKHVSLHDWETVDGIGLA